MTAEEVRSVVFQKAAVGGYKQADVDLFLDEVAVCIEGMTAKIRALEKARFEAGKSAPAQAVAVPQKPAAELEKAAPRPQGYEGLSDYGIQNLLLKAQKLAEQIEQEAKQASEELLAKSAADAQDILARADADAEETIEKANAILADAQRKEASINAAARAEAENIINEAVARSGQMLTSTREKLKEEQEMCQKLRNDFHQVRDIIINFYEEQLKELNSEAISEIAEIEETEIFTESEVEIEENSRPEAEDAADDAEEATLLLNLSDEDKAEEGVEEQEEEELPEQPEEEPEIQLNFSMD